jgi:hypothetical protein
MDIGIMEGWINPPNRDNILWRIDPLMGKDLETDKEYSRLYAILCG